MLSLICFKSITFLRSLPLFSFGENWAGIITMGITVMMEILKRRQEKKLGEQRGLLQIEGSGEASPSKQ